ncbi:hypothetical protein BCEP4_1350059 [Burkholderia cepacia]|nr:hypothetical protein BCEP4_1350059 [Burkholderia cepacia]
MGKGAGYTSAQGAIMVGFVNWAGTPGSVAIGWLTDRFDRYGLFPRVFAWRYGHSGPRTGCSRRSGPSRCSPLLGDRSFPAPMPA